MKAIVPITTLLAVICGMTQDAVAQVVPDNTVGTQVTQTGGVFGINNGTRSGNNLFHSFSQFSVPTGGSAIFNNALDVQNIFSRVTGSQLSDIDGILKTQGTANLFLMNPNGVVFRENAQLQLGGSFLGTTASSIKFADGIEFDTVNATPALLSVNLPIGLQMGRNTGPITVKGIGHNIVRPSIFSPVPLNTNPSNLSVKPGFTVGLVGNTVSLEGGSLKAPNGRIAVVSLSAGQLELGTDPLGWTFNKINDAQWSDINISKANLIDASGNPGGTIKLLGRDINLRDSSVILIQNQGVSNADQISVWAAGTLAIGGSLPNRDQSMIAAETLGRGRAADINLEAQRIQLAEGGVVLSTTFVSGGPAGNISVRAKDSISAAGFLPSDPSRVSGIISSTLFGGGQGGNVSVETQKLSLYDGGGIAALVFGGLAGGDMDVKADTIDLVGDNPLTSAGSVLTATSFFGGNAGKLLVDARRILVQNGGVISSSTLNRGMAGNLTIHASESIQVLGRGRFEQESRIAAAAALLSPLFQQVFRLPAMPTGDSGNLSISSPLVQVQDGASIRVNNEGTGTAGKLLLSANVLQLDRDSAVTASTRSGQGGDIKLIIQDNLVLRRGSRITATTTGIGNGGNITIDSPIVVGLENSDIVANALEGKGGNIAITTQGILGLKFRPALTPDNDITASSEFGINGNVQVNTIGINPANSLNALPHEIVDSSRQIADRCGAAKTSSFIATGRGGIPQGPGKRRGSDRSWNDLRPIVTTTSTTIEPLALSQLRSQPLVEASAVEVDATGSIVLVAAKPIGVQTAATCGMGEVKN